MILPNECLRKKRIYMKACQLKPTLNVIYTLIKVCVFLYCFIPIQLVINTSNHTYKITASLQLSSSLQAKKPDTASHSSSKAVKTNTAPAHLDATWLKIAQQKISAKPIPAMLKKLQKITPCSSSTKNTHIAVRFHLSLDPNRTIQDEIKWLALQLNTANQLFESIQVCFSVQSLLTLPKASMHMKTRTQRTALGRKKKRLQSEGVTKSLCSCQIIMDSACEVFKLYNVFFAPWYANCLVPEILRNT